MYDIVSGYTHHLHYAVPPLVGAFIGYITNKIAIKMLFRPLKPWTLLGKRIPMTPGVIPSRRHQLAKNIGKMVGSHLLTGEEIVRGLEKEAFQNQLSALVSSRLENILTKDFASLSDLVPPGYATYFDLAKRTFSYHVKSHISSYFRSQHFRNIVQKILDEQRSIILKRDINSFADREKREILYCNIEDLISSMLKDEGLEPRLEAFLLSKMNTLIDEKKSLRQILPAPLLDTIMHLLEEKAPEILAQLARLLKEEEVRKKLAETFKRIIDAFAKSLGPLGSMVQGFVDIETIERVMREYFEKHEEEIEAMIRDPEVQERILTALCERIEVYLNAPLDELLGDKKDVSVEKISRTLALQLATLLRHDDVSRYLGRFLRDGIERYLDDGNKNLRTVVHELYGKGRADEIAGQLSLKVIDCLTSEKAMSAMGSMVDATLDAFLGKRLGRLSRLIPPTVVNGVCNHIIYFANNLFATEITGFVRSFDIGSVISNKIDSLDLLKLEELLLSIMKEQFRYINLFGAIIGFAIGCCNLLYIVLL